jgi:hypothetical protein
LVTELVVVEWSRIERYLVVVMGAKDNESRLEEESRSKGLGGEERQQQQLKRKEDQNRRQRACRERKRRARQLLREAHQQQQQQQQSQPHRGGQEEEEEEEEEEGQQQQQRQQHQAPVQVATTQAEEEERRKVSSSSSSVAVVVKVEKSPGEKLHIESSGPQAPQQVDLIAQKSYAQRKKEDQNRRQRECRERKRRSQELENREKQKRAQQELLSELGKESREAHLGGGATEVMGHHHQSKAVQVVEGESTSMERSASERAKELAPILHELTAGNGVEYQKLTLAKLLQQPLLQPVLPTFVSELDKGVRHAH